MRNEFDEFLIRGRLRKKGSRTEAPAKIPVLGAPVGAIQTPLHRFVCADSAVILFQCLSKFRFRNYQSGCDEYEVSILKGEWKCLIFQNAGESYRYPKNLLDFLYGSAVLNGADTVRFCLPGKELASRLCCCSSSSPPFSLACMPTRPIPN